MDGKDFGKLIAGLEDALAYAKGRKSPGARAHRVKVDRPVQRTVELGEADIAAVEQSRMAPGFEALNAELEAPGSRK